MPRLKEKYFEAKILRRKGYSFNEITKKLNISKSTASIWLRDIKLSKSAIERLKRRCLLGYEKTREKKRLKREKIDKDLKKEAETFLSSVKLGKKHLKMFCALLYECEGTKNTASGISFSNSNPELVKLFLFLLRSSFEIDEKRFRVCVHIHDYHSPKKQMSFWSKITGISKKQFIKPYQKPNTGKRIKDNYQGCANIRYFDSLLARRLSLVSKIIMEKYGRVG
ncbi:MAG: hypothetical protein COU84_00010 [Candidatus Portnoybacteria bacterium CG10_big_fil_rev_8_21_14_0_10_43_39]|uniref:Uncharacterized protein n=1 Tax=Candidatus Portnoybacteria bacterium CG10_big_fil_rev_8_21_14_0_10_43_39 TaxID=1974815 RepID=A0A2M8KI52_9BACT|nr:MAG: hypothetical protein COU84_00010 [Candidatus Portnoybacteria bacterium CG10_big_fil_rev_8_21_14_0_10_43_39]